MSDLLGVDVDGGESLAGEGKLDGVSADSTKSVDDDVAAAATGDAASKGLGRHRVPRLAVHLDAAVKAVPEVVALVPVFPQLLARLPDSSTKLVLTKFWSLAGRIVVATISTNYIRCPASD